MAVNPLFMTISHSLSLASVAFEYFQTNLDFNKSLFLDSYPTSVYLVL